MQSIPGNPDRPATASVRRGSISALLATALAVTTFTAPAMAEVAEPKPEGPLLINYVSTQAHSDLSFLNELKLKTSGANAIDIAILDSAVVGFDGTKAVLEVPDHLNTVLTDGAAQIDALQAADTRVTLGVAAALEGKGAGLANFPDDAAAQAFATEIADLVAKHGLDGVDLREAGKSYTAGERNIPSFIALIAALRAELGESSFLSYAKGGQASSALFSYNSAGATLDLISNNIDHIYEVPYVEGTEEKIAPASVSYLGTPTATAAEWARRTKAANYEAMMVRNLPVGNTSAFISAMTEHLVGEATVYVDEIAPALTAELDRESVVLAAQDRGELASVTADLYDASGTTVLQSIDAAADWQLSSNAFSFEDTWMVPADLDSGSYLIRVTATDVSGNSTKVDLAKEVVNRGVNLEVAVSRACEDGAAVLNVAVTNTSPAAADVTIATHQGSLTEPDIAPGAKVTRTFATEGAAFDAGVAIVAASSNVDDVPHREVYREPYTEFDCAAPTEEPAEPTEPVAPGPPPTIDIVRTEKPEAPKTAIYVEVNDNDMSLVADYTLEGSNAPFFDIAIIFAANINYDAEADKAVVGLNPRVSETLENADTQIRPLQEQGTEVLLSILGNHTRAGVSNFQTQEEAETFAQEVADVVDQYGLDGVDIDDEWVAYGSGDTPAVNPLSIIWFIQSLRERLGEDKIITLYNYGSAADTTEGELQAGPDIDYAFNPGYGLWIPPRIEGMDKSQFSPSASVVPSMDATDRAEAQRTIDEGYGAFMMYNLTSGDHSEKFSYVSEVFYGAEVNHKYVAPDESAPQIEVSAVAGPADFRSVDVTVSDERALDLISVDLYDAANEQLLAPIWSNGEEPLDTWKVTDSHDLPTGLEPGEYTVRVTATDPAGNSTTALATVTIPDLRVPLELTADASCVDGDVVLEVNAANAAGTGATVSFVSDHGSLTLAQIAAEGTGTHEFATGADRVAAGDVSVIAAATIDGTPHLSVQTVDYDGFTCTAGAPTEPGEPGEPGGPDGLTDDNRGGVQAPATVFPGQSIELTIPAPGTQVRVWMYSTPQLLMQGAVPADSAVQVVVPTNLSLGEHRFVVFDSEGNLIGWAPTEVVPAGAGELANTGADIRSLLVLVVLLLCAGAALLARRVRLRHHT